MTISSLTLSNITERDKFECYARTRLLACCRAHAGSRILLERVLWRGFDRDIGQDVGALRLPGLPPTEQMECLRQSVALCLFGDNGGCVDGYLELNYARE